MRGVSASRREKRVDVRTFEMRENKGAAGLEGAPPGFERVRRSFVFRFHPKVSGMGSGAKDESEHGFKARLAEEKVAQAPRRELR